MIKFARSSFNSIDEIKEYVLECETNFEAELSSLTNKVCKETELKIITLSGPTCSGKTTASKKLVETFSEHSKNMNIISIDDFYYDKQKLHEISLKKGMDTVDYDSVDTIDLEALEKVIEEIFDQAQKDVHVPVFDFTAGKRIGYKTLRCDENDIFLFEGIQALYPEIHVLFEAHKYCDIFICVDSSIEVDGVVFEPNEIRLLRRLVRDSIFRATSPEFTFDIWKGVRENEDVNIFPYADKCKYRLDSAFPCELSLLKPYLTESLSIIDGLCVNGSIVSEILAKIEHIQPISKKYLSDNSFYLEFI